MDPIFSLHQVSVTRAAGNGEPRFLLRDLSLTIPAGARWSVVGLSGAGKSTLLRVLNRFESIASGEVQFQGRELKSYAPADLRRQVALLAQEPVWLTGTARDNLLASVKLGLVPEAEAEERLHEVLPLAGIPEDWLDRTEDALSVGQRQRVCLGRVLLSRPCVLLLDEPTSSLDPPGARALVDALRALGDRRELTLLMVTHRLAEARRFGGEVLVLDGGSRSGFGPAERVIPELEASWGEAAGSGSGGGTP